MQDSFGDGWNGNTVLTILLVSQMTSTLATEKLGYDYGIPDDCYQSLVEIC